MNRRNFIKNTAISSIATAAFSPLPAFTKGNNSPLISFGICADLHQDFTPDAPRRLSAFIDDMNLKKPDFIIQMGDFCCPLEKNKEIMDIWQQYKGPKYHVIGNHDLEGNKYTRKQLIHFWGLKAPYYSFDIKKYHFIILDGNEHNPSHEPAWKYERFISNTQIQWLENDIEMTNLPVIVFLHQGLDNDGGIENATKVRQVFYRANQKAGKPKVKLVFTGHHHQDYHNVINDIHYIQINSTSYHWQGHQYAESPFDKKLNKAYPLLKYMAYYKDPLWATINIYSDGLLLMQGRKSAFLGRTPIELGMPTYEFAYPVVPRISDRKIQLVL